MISVVTASTLLAYAFYTISPETVAKFGTDHLLWTVPFPLYGIFRYLYLVHQREGGGNPSETAARPIGRFSPASRSGALAVIAILYGPLALRPEAMPWHAPKVAILRTTPATVLADYHELMNLAGYQDVIAQGRGHGAQGQHLVALLLSRAARRRRGSSRA